MNGYYLRTHPYKEERRHGLLYGMLAFLVLAGLCAHFFLHAYLIRYVNRKLNEIPGYRAHLNDIGIHLWRGAYSIEGLDVLKREGDAAVPFFKAPTIDISLQWKELLHRHVVAKVMLLDPQINFISSDDKEIQQTNVKGSWRDQVKALIPFKLNYVKVRNGSIHWRDPASDPPMDIYLHALDIDAYNLTNSERLSNTLASTVLGKAIVMDGGDLHFEATADPYEKMPTFKSKLVLERLALPQLNTFFKKYAAIEVHDGTFNLYAELAASKGELSGYVKPLLDHLDTMNLKPEKKHVGEVVKGTLVEIVTAILTNNPKDRVGSRLEVTGRFDQPGINKWVAFTSALHNAFIAALPASLDNALNLEDRNKIK
jgi:hypothetical protein